MIALLGSSLASPLPTAALDAMRSADCQRCHTLPGEPEAPREHSCAACHRWIRDVSQDPRRRAMAMELFPLWERYERHIRSYLDVPNLTAALARLEASWVERWLLDPHDVRPQLDEGMPRFGFGPATARTIAGAFAASQAPVPPTPAPDPANLHAGRAKMLTYGCPSCHNLGAALPASPGLPSAPDLAFTRERMTPDRVVAWIVDPKGMTPAATMPSLDVPREDAILMRDYIFLVEPGWALPPEPAPSIVPLSRPVRWAEVEERVFGKICAHCHMDPSLPQNQGRPGPGNGGGFGFPPTGIHLQSPEAIRPHREAIIAALLRRRQEARRDHLAPGQAPAPVDRTGKPGMPLGLPPLPDEDIALVMAWFEQGAPR